MNELSLPKLPLLETLFGDMDAVGTTCAEGNSGDGLSWRKCEGGCLIGLGAWPVVLLQSNAVLSKLQT